MKRDTLLSLSTLSLALMVGCSDKPAESSTSATPPPAKPAATEEVKQAVTKATEEVVAEVQKQAKAAYADLSQQLLTSTKGASDDLLKSISTDLGARVQKLSESLKTNEGLTQQLGTAVNALLGNKDGEAVGGLSSLTAAKLTPEQTTLAKEVYNAAAALVTQRNFSSLEGMNSDVSKLATSVWKGNYTEALPPLQKLYSQTSLTPAQKDLLGKMYDSYMPAGWKDSAAKLQQGLDTLKKFGQ